MKKKKRNSEKIPLKVLRGEIYICTECNRRERIPEDVLEYFDLVNPRSPLTGPHVFSCEKCGAEMYPKSWLEQQKGEAE